MIIDVEVNGVQTLRYESDAVPRVGEEICLMMGIKHCKHRRLKVLNVAHLLSESLEKIRHTQICVDTAIVENASEATNER